MFIKKIRSPRILKRLLIERFSEPLHLNIVAFFVFIFGSFRSKIFFDLIFRQHNAYSILESATLAKKMGYQGISILELGVASGAGLMNMSLLAKKIAKLVGIEIHVYGFDSGEGLTPPQGYKDYSDRFLKGDYPVDLIALKQKLGDNTKLVLGDVKVTAPNFIDSLDPKFPIAYIVLDLDLYTSSRDSFLLLNGDSEKYLPTIHLYMDDIDEFRHSSYCGEELAVSEFNERNEFRKIEKNVFIETYRVFKNAKWLKKMFKIHIFDHSCFDNQKERSSKVLYNPYLK